MSERGIIVTDPIYDDELREAIHAYMKDWQKGCAVVCLSVIGAPGGLYAGAEKEDAEDLAVYVSDLLRKRQDLEDDYTIKIHCIPDSDKPCVYIASKYVRREEPVKKKHALAEGEGRP